MACRPLARLAPVALVLFACGDGGGSSPAHGRPENQTLELRPASGSAPLVRRRVVARFDVLREAPDWVLRAGHQTHETLSADTRRESRNVLTLSGGVGPEDLLEVRIPGRFDPSEINRVALTLVAPDPRTLQAALIRDGREIVSARPVVTGGQPGLREIVLDLVGSGETEDCDHVSVSFLGEGGPIQLASVELRREPMVGTLPPLDAPALLEIAGEWALATGLSSRHPLECSLRVREGAQLLVEYGLPPHVRLPGSVRELRAVVTSESGQVHYYQFPFEYEQVIEYSTRPTNLRRFENRVKRELANIRDPYLRAKRLQKMIRAGEEDGVPDEAFDPLRTAPAARSAKSRPKKQGLIDAWCAASVPLDAFEGEQVTVRFELLEDGMYESVCALGRPRLVVPDPEAPTVLLITVDALRADHLALGRRGAPIETPWIDKLAERGVVFESAWAPSNGVLASNAALQTGRSPRDTRLLTDGQRVSDQALTLAEAFREAGWDTVAVLSSGVLSPDLSGLGQGFQRVFTQRTPERGVEGAFEDLKLALVDSRDVPLFAWLHLHDPNAPYDPPRDFRREYYPEDSDPYAPELPEPRRAPPAWDVAVRDLGYIEGLYKGELTWIDRKLREIVEHPRLRRGTVAFVGAYGESLESFGHERLTPETLHVPLILTGPELPAGRRVSRPVQTVDLGRTLLDLAGLPDAPFPGSTLRGPAASFDGKETPRFALSADGSTAAIVRDGLLLTLRIERVNGGRHTVELFDVAADPVGRENLAQDRPADVRELRAQLVEWLASAGEFHAVAVPAERGLPLEGRMETLGIERVTHPPTGAAWIAADCSCEACAALRAVSE